MKHIIFLIILAVFSECRQENKSLQDAVTEIKIVPEESNQADVLQILENISLTPLETKDECLISNVRKIKTDENGFYLTEHNHSPVKIFSQSGKFISAVGRRGSGPGEYIQIDDILVSNDTVCIGAWSGNKKWIRYSRDNRFLYETDMTFPFDEICRTGNDNYLVYVANGVVSDESNFYLYCLDDNFKLLSRLDPKTPPTDLALGVEQNHFFQNKEHTLYIKEYCDTVYTISDNMSIRPKYHLDFGKHWYSKSFLEQYHDKNLMETNDAVDRNRYARWINFWENDRHLIINYYIGNDNKKHDIYLAVYFKNTGKILNFKAASGDLYANLITHPYCVRENQFISLIPADKLLELASNIKGNDSLSEKIRECAKQISETDNPVLVQFDFKSTSGL